MFATLLCVVSVTISADVRLKASLPYVTAYRFCVVTHQPILVVLHQGQADDSVKRVRATMAEAGVVMVVGEADAMQYRSLWLAVGQPCTPTVIYLYWHDGLRFNNFNFPPVVPAIVPDQLRVWLDGNVGQLRQESRSRLGFCPLNLPPPSR